MSTPNNKNNTYIIEAKKWLEESDDTFLNNTKFLIESGWKPDDKNEHGETLLHMAVRSNKWKSVDWLVSSGCDCTAKNKHGHTPVWLARRKNDRHFQPLFKKEFVIASKNGLLNNKPIQNQTNSNPPIKNKTKTNSNSFVVNSDVQEWTEALSVGDTKKAKQYLYAGMNLSGFNENGRNPLHEAIYQNAWEAVEYLISYGSKVSSLDKDGLSGIDYIEKKWNDGNSGLDYECYEMVKFAIEDEKVSCKISNESAPVFKNEVKPIKHNNKKPLNIKKERTKTRSYNDRIFQERVELQDNIKINSSPQIIMKKHRTI